MIKMAASELKSDFRFFMRNCKNSVLLDSLARFVGRPTMTFDDVLQALDEVLIANNQQFGIEIASIIQCQTLQEALSRLFQHNQIFDKLFWKKVWKLHFEIELQHISHKQEFPLAFPKPLKVTFSEFDHVKPLEDDEVKQPDSSELLETDSLDATSAASTESNCNHANDSEQSLSPPDLQSPPENSQDPLSIDQSLLRSLEALSIVPATVSSVDNPVETDTNSLKASAKEQSIADAIPEGDVAVEFFAALKSNPPPFLVKYKPLSPLLAQSQQQCNDDRAIRVQPSVECMTPPKSPLHNLGSTSSSRLDGTILLASLLVSDLLTGIDPLSFTPAALQSSTPLGGKMGVSGAHLSDELSDDVLSHVAVSANPHGNSSSFLPSGDVGEQPVQELVPSNGANTPPKPPSSNLLGSSLISDPPDLLAMSKSPHLVNHSFGTQPESDSTPPKPPSSNLLGSSLISDPPDLLAMSKSPHLVNHSFGTQPESDSTIPRALSHTSSPLGGNIGGSAAPAPPSSNLLGSAAPAPPSSNLLGSAAPAPPSSNLLWSAAPAPPSSNLLWSAAPAPPSSNLLGSAAPAPSSSKTVPTKCCDPRISTAFYSRPLGQDKGVTMHKSVLNDWGWVLFAAACLSATSSPISASPPHWAPINLGPQSILGA
jgi:hypothetical protein